MFYNRNPNFCSNGVRGAFGSGAVHFRVLVSNAKNNIIFISYDNLRLVMDSRQQTSIAVLAIACFLSILTSISDLKASEVPGQLQNTSNATSTSTNLTQARVPEPMAILTQSDFGELTDSLNSAGDAIKDNDPAGALGDLASAETDVRVFMMQVGGEDSLGGQQLLTILKHINMAQDASGTNDTTKASQEINSANTELLKITQTLPEN